MTTANQAADRRKPSRTQQGFSFVLNTSASVQLSRFQRIGCFIRIVDGIGISDPHDTLLERQYALDYLTSIEGFETFTAEILIKKETGIRETFETVWNHIDDYEKSVALWLNYETSCNYWPYWDIYNQALLPHIKLASGSPEDIIGLPYQTLPSLMMNRQHHTSSTNTKTELQIPTEVDGYPHVFAEHNYCEVSCRDHYFSKPQQVYVILNALDDVYEDSVNQEYARDLLLNRLRLAPELTESLIKEKKWPRRFSLLWESLSDTLKSDLIAEDWDWYDSYWPGLECYNQILCSFMHLSSGKPTEIFGAAYQGAPESC